MRIRAVAKGSFVNVLVCQRRTPTLRDLTVDIAAGENLVWGLYSSACNVTLEGVTVLGSAGDSADAGVWGVDFTGGLARVHNLRVDIGGGPDSDSIGVAIFDDTSAIIRDSTIDIALPADNFRGNSGLFIASADARLDDVLVALRGGDGYAILGDNDSGTHALRIEHSTLASRGAALAFGSEAGALDSTVAVADSQLDGAFSPFDDGVVTDFRCVGAYDGLFQPLGPTCLPLAPARPRLADSPRISAALAAHRQVAQRHASLATR